MYRRMAVRAAKLLARWVASPHCGAADTDRLTSSRSPPVGRTHSLAHHSRGLLLEPGQYVAVRDTERPTDAGALASIGTLGDNYENALADFVIGLYKTEIASASRGRSGWSTS